MTARRQFTYEVPLAAFAHAGGYPTSVQYGGEPFLPHTHAPGPKQSWTHRPVSPGTIIYNKGHPDWGGLHDSYDFPCACFAATNHRPFSNHR